MGASNNVDKARLENVWGIFTRGNAGADLTVIAFHRRGLAVLSRGQHCHLLDNECNSRKRKNMGCSFFHSMVIFSTKVPPLYRESAGHHVLLRIALSHRNGSFQ